MSRQVLPNIVPIRTLIDLALQRDWKSILTHAFIIDIQYLDQLNIYTNRRQISTLWSTFNEVNLLRQFVLSNVWAAMVRD